jgi:hypothetical protein
MIPNELIVQVLPIAYFSLFGLGYRSHSRQHITLLLARRQVTNGEKAKQCQLPQCRLSAWISGSDALAGFVVCPGSFQART